MRITAGNMHFRELNEQIRACPDAEITMLEGGQPVYHYLISVE